MLLHGTEGEGLAEDRGGAAAVQAHRGQLVEPDGLDQPAYLRLRAGEPQGPALRAQPLREHREVDDDRRVGEAKLREVDDDVARRVQRRRDGTPAAPARRPVLVPRDSQYR